LKFLLDSPCNRSIDKRVYRHHNEIRTSDRLVDTGPSEARTMPRDRRQPGKRSDGRRDTMIETAVREDVVCVKGTVPFPGAPVVYVFWADGMLVDTGPSRLTNELIAFYQSIRFERVALTHSHEDHTGTAHWIEETLQVPIDIHPKGIDSCRQPTDCPPYRKAAWGDRDAFMPRPLEPVIHSRNSTWKVIETPGHADDHVVFLDEATGRLFSGDLFLSPKIKVIMRHESIPVMMRSLRTVLAHDFQAMYCCHAGYVPDGRRMLQMKLEYLENLSGEILHLYEAGLSIPEINRKLFPESPLIVAASNHEMDSEHIIRSVVAEWNP
jgi:glyoxylase-like metal-dependent hydrolase (beta-lactamase superfamily II)